MRVMVLRGGELRIEALERPRPAAGQVLARVRACGICGSDLHFARYAEQMVRLSRESGAAGWGGIDLDQGVVMGHEFVAEVVECGEGAEAWQSGSPVVSLPVLLNAPDAGAGSQSIGYSSRIPGAYGEYVLLSAPLLLPVPAHVPDRLAAMTEPCAVGLHAVRAAHVQADERVLIMGAGPIGLMTLLWLRHEGVSDICVSDPSAPRRELALRAGATRVIDPRSAGVVEALAAAGGPPRVVFECVGVPGTLQEAMSLVTRQGRVIVAGVCMPEDRITPMTGILKQLTLQFVLAYSPAEFSEALAAIAAGAVDVAPLVTRGVSLADLPATFAALGDANDCKVVLEFDA